MTTVHTHTASHMRTSMHTLCLIEQSRQHMCVVDEVHSQQPTILGPVTHPREDFTKTCEKTLLKRKLIADPTQIFTFREKSVFTFQSSQCDKLNVRKGLCSLYFLSTLKLFHWKLLSAFWHRIGIGLLRCLPLGMHTKWGCESPRLTDFTFTVLV